ncbi:unnamed protein product [Rotaria magnacalcarata]|uniref:Uncharacterized protein n=2 Tax=Rotaria magnacalcarata TaxID=392030 RepID=A0A816HC65_9BILA|nr:unnamed protein product [Rotaria magnacalcarata]CAF1686279.1 unnamed protein product [Rotaria magnacalcarata]CAF2036132.1 unnamed protein product [Rotaria magnacalcarata]CAF3767208.1 unnamed protein product [Rotaria magnacalcarata]CAF3834827.1 unnamed protein product [Rotaria magnacalcarata]
MHACYGNFHAGMFFKYSREKQEELMHRATRQGHAFSLETYLNYYTEKNINQQYVYGRSKWTLLIAACFYRHENIVRMLMHRFKPDVDAVGNIKLDFVHDIMYSVSPLWVAVAVGHFGIVKLLVEEGNANVNHLSITRSSPLRAASYIGRLDIVRYLIMHGADMKLVRDGNYTNLMLSAYRGHTHIVEYFLDKLGCDPNEFDRDGRTALHYGMDGDSVEVVRLLLKYGTKNISHNAISPLMLAALEARENLVDAFEKYCCSNMEWIEAREILGATYANIESKNYNIDKAIEHITIAYKWRIEKNLPKASPSILPIEAFNYSQECQTLDEFNHILFESNTRLHIESLLIQERLLGQKNKRYRHAVRFYGTVLADANQYHASLQFWLYELNIRREHNINFDKWHLRGFVHIFSKMIKNNVDIISEKAILEILKALNDELANGSSNDHNLFTLFYLITVISHASEEQRLSTYMIDIYRKLVIFVRTNYTTQENSQHWTLLHLSMMVGVQGLNDNHIITLCKYPCHKTIGLLLQCGANVDTVDSKRNTPLHLIAQRTCDIDTVLFIIDMLCNTFGAHSDCVNDQGETPLETASNIRVKEHLRKKIGVGQLKCLCARFIQQTKVVFQDYHFPLTLVNFIEKH